MTIGDVYAITYSPDYYSTDCKVEVLEEYSFDIARQIMPGSIVLELGSGENNLRNIPYDLGTWLGQPTAMHLSGLRKNKAASQRSPNASEASGYLRS